MRPRWAWYPVSSSSSMAAIRRIMRAATGGVTPHFQRESSGLRSPEKDTRSLSNVAKDSGITFSLMLTRVRSPAARATPARRSTSSSSSRLMQTPSSTALARAAMVLLEPLRAMSDGSAPPANVASSSPVPKQSPPAPSWCSTARTAKLGLHLMAYMTLTGPGQAASNAARIRR